MIDVPRDVLAEVMDLGCLDWLQASDVQGYVLELGAAGSGEPAMQVSIRLIRDLLERGYIRVGDLRGGAFVPWTESAPQALERIEREWSALLPRGPNLGDVCWIELTPSGQAFARTLRGSREEG